MQHIRSHFHLFRNREMDSLYFTLALLHFGEGLISIFIPIYFLTLEYKLWEVFLFYFLRSAFFILATIILLPQMKKYSDKMLMFVSTPFIIFYFFGLGFVDIWPVLFYILPLFSALSLLLFNVGYHLSFADAADEGFIGREVSVRLVGSMLAKFAAPFAGGALIVALGFRYVFVVGSIILLFSVLPLFYLSKKKYLSHADIDAVFGFIKNKSLRPFNILGIGYATESMVSWIVWPIFIYFTVGSIEEFGGIISVGLFGGAIMTYMVGFLSDTGKRRRVMTISAMALCLIWLVRLFISGVYAVVEIHIIGDIIVAGLMVAWTSQFYSIARGVNNAGLFILSREIIYHLARAVFLPILAILAYFLPIHQFFGISFVFGALFTLFYLFGNKQHLSKINKDMVKA